jgi:hypothetical protein
LLASLIAFSCTGTSGEKPATTTQGPFQEGDAWLYKARPGEENSIVVIGKVEDRVIHVQIQGLALRNRYVAGGIQKELGHLPISEAALSTSVTSRTTGHLSKASFEEGYGVWEHNQGGVFTLTVSELIDLLEGSMQ